MRWLVRQYSRVVNDVFIKVGTVLVNSVRVLYNRFNMYFTSFHFRMSGHYMFIPSILRTDNRDSINVLTLKYIHALDFLSIERLSLIHI